jgi:hypothetical protein
MHKLSALQLWQRGTKVIIETFFEKLWAFFVALCATAKAFNSYGTELRRESQSSTEYLLNLFLSETLGLLCGSLCTSKDAEQLWHRGTRRITERHRVINETFFVKRWAFFVGLCAIAISK